MKKAFHIKNCYGDDCWLTVELNDVDYIFKQTLSGDELLIVLYKNGKSVVYDSDMHCRIQSFDGDCEMIYPKQFEIWGEKLFNPNETDEFVGIKGE